MLATIWISHIIREVETCVIVFVYVLCGTTMKACGGSGCIDPHFLDLGTSWR
jgi:hypothetical protein